MQALVDEHAGAFQAWEDYLKSLHTIADRLRSGTEESAAGGAMPWLTPVLPELERAGRRIQTLMAEIGEQQALAVRRVLEARSGRDVMVARMDLMMVMLSAGNRLGYEFCQQYMRLLSGTDRDF